MLLEARGADRPPLRYPLDPARHAVIGRGEDADIRVDHDPHVSRRHAEVWIEEGVLNVAVLPGAGDPVFQHGAEITRGSVEPGDHFVIGRTRFILLADRPATVMDETRLPTLRETLPTEGDLAAGQGADRLRLLDLLELPEILASRSPPEYFLHLSGLLRMATGAQEACVINEAGTILARDAVVPAGRPAGLSRALIREALEGAPRPILYTWAPAGGGRAPTAVEGVDWAICVALTVTGDAPILFYLTGRGGRGEQAAHELRDRGRFAGLVGDMVSRSLAMRRLEALHGRMQRYFPRAVIAKIASSAEQDELEPKLAVSTVMFFDLRGFSRKTEGRNAKILAYSGELRRVMTSMTEEIFREQGVVLQYLGDGILACWNVPIADPAHVDRACRAALAMVAALARTGEAWHCGIGLHTGEVVAGSLGSEQLFAYTVMGDVVNRTARIEGITKIVETPVLVTGEVAAQVSAQVAGPLRIGRFQPAGMEVPVDLFALIAPGGDTARPATFTAGLAAFERGAWEEAYETLSALGPRDRPARYLMALAEAHRRHPPRQWNGVIELSEK